MGNMRKDGPGQYPGNTTFCPFNNGNSCSKDTGKVGSNRFETTPEFMKWAKGRL